MDWLNRIDDALDDAAHTSRRIQSRRKKRIPNDAANLSELVTHLRSTKTKTPSTITPSSRNETADVQSSFHFPSQGSSDIQSNSVEKTRQYVNHLDDTATALFDVGLMVHQQHQTLTPQQRLSKNSPWGQALDSMMTDQSPPKRNHDERDSSTILPSNLEDRSAARKHVEAGFVEGRMDDVLSKEDGSQQSSTHAVKKPLISADGADVGSTDIDDKDKKSLYPQHVLLKSQFEVDQSHTSFVDDESIPFDPSMNCYGVVHVRILNAQRLPCPVGSQVHAVVALPPWKGKVRTPKTRAFSAVGAAVNVCVDWSDMENAVVSMVHAYSSEESPVPSIRVALVFSAGSLGVLEFEMCFVELKCTVLLKNPAVPIIGWFETTKSLDKTSEKPQRPAEHADSPLVQIEAVFEPEDKAAVKAFPIKGTNDSLAVQSEHRADDSSVAADDSSSPSTSFDEFDDSPQSQLLAFLPESKVATSLRALRHDDRSQSDYSTSLSSFRPVDAVVSSLKPHHLRLKVFYLLAQCDVCSRSIASGFRKIQAFRCEKCGVDCCNDCRLQVDFRLPCGSTYAQTAVEHSIQSKITPENILRVVAPIPESDSGSKVIKADRPIISATRSFGTSGAAVNVRSASGIGVLKAKIIRAVVFQSPLSFPSDIPSSQNVKKGDYYIRIKSSNGDTVRTKSVQQSGRPNFASGEMRLTVPHYGVYFSLELVDDSSDLVIGATILPANAILQDQRDAFASATIVPFVWIFGGPVAFNQPRRVVFELKKAKKQNAAAFFSEASDGTTVGTVELDILLEEDLNALYGVDPYKCPPRADDQLDLAILQSHIARISSIIRDAKKLVQIYTFMVSWDNPVITGICAFIYIQGCIYCDSKYIGAFPVFIILVLMVYLGFDRAHGRFQRRYVNRELDKIRERDSRNPPVHRPIGMVKVRIMKGSNLKYPDYGLPGSAVCRVFLDPCRLSSEDDKKRYVAFDEAASATHDLGCTESVYSSDPIWRKWNESAPSKRLRQLLPSDGNFFDCNAEDVNAGFCFPVLQPAQRNGQSFALAPWSTCSSAVVFEVRFSDLVSILPGTEHVLGEVVVPISELIAAGEIRGWFKVIDIENVDREMRHNSKLVNDGSPQLLIQINWIPPERVLGSSPNQEREASYVVQEEMIRAAIMSRQQKITLLGSSIGALNTVRGLSNTLRSVQNVLGSVLDAVEAFFNVFNFSDPYKSSVVFSVMVIVWMALSIIPTRLLFLVAGLCQFAITLISRFFPPTVSNKGSHGTVQSDKPSPTKSSSSIATWVSNAFMGLPSDEDLRRTYYWNTRRVVAHETLSRSTEKRNAKLTALWNASWHGPIEMIPSGSNQRQSVFGVVEGDRFLWWKSTESFDQGEASIGQLLLHGHAGIATPSPVEMREARDGDLHRIVVIFGRGRASQQRIAILCQDSIERLRFEEAVLQTVARKVD
ncbi:hypothetical protein ACA910_001699 [Epithemia clementina (nom. ined.)]